MTPPARKRPANYGKPYTDQELMYIRYAIGAEHPRQIAGKLKRTIRGITDQAEKMGLSVENLAKRADGMSRSDVVDALGVTSRVLYCLIRDEKIACSRRETGKRNNTRRYVYTFDPYEVEAFLRDGGALLLMRPNDPIWREIYEEARADLLRRYISGPDLWRVLSMSSNSVPDNWRAVGFPVPAISWQAHYYDRAAVAAWLAAYRPHYLTRSVKRALGVEE